MVAKQLRLKRTTHHAPRTTHRHNWSMTERTACVTVDGGSARHKVLHRLTHGCRPQIHGKVACWNRRLSEALADRNRSNTRCVDGDTYSTPRHRRHHDAKTYTLAGITRQLRLTVELVAPGTGAWRGMTAAMAAVALMTAWASPAARAQNALLDSFRVAGAPTNYVIPDRGGSGHTYNLGGGLSTRSADGDGISNFAYLNGNNNVQVGTNVVVVPWFIHKDDVHIDHSGTANTSERASPVGDNWFFRGGHSAFECSTDDSITGDIVTEFCTFNFTFSGDIGATRDRRVARRVRNPRLNVTVTVYDADGQAFTASCRRSNTNPLAFIMPAGTGTSLVTRNDTLENDARCHTPQTLVSAHGAGRIDAASLNTAFNAPMYAEGNPDTASYTYTGTINNETLTTRRTCSVNVVGTPGPNNPCPEGTNPVLYPNSGIPTGGWTQIGMSEIISPTTLKVWYDRQSGPLNLSFPFRTTISRAFPTFANFLAAWNAGDNDWHNPFTGGFTTIPGPGRVLLISNNVNLATIHCENDRGTLRAAANISEYTILYNFFPAMRTLCLSTPYALTRQSVAAIVAEQGTLDYNDGWGAWSAGNITDKNQTRTCNAGTGGHCANAYGGGTTNHGGTEARPSETFWNNYIVNGPAGHTDATEVVSPAGGLRRDIQSVAFTRDNGDGRLQFNLIMAQGPISFNLQYITIEQATPSSGILFTLGAANFNISLKSGLSRPNPSWTAIPGSGVVFYRPSANNGVVLLDTSCNASGDLRVRSGTTTDTEQTVQASSSLCNIGASASDITKQVIGELSATDNFIYDAALVSLGAIQDSTPNTPANVGDILTAGAPSHPRLTVNASAWQWQRCTTQDCSSATAISPGGTAATYTVQAADQGNWLRVQVTQGGDFNDTLFSNSVQADRRGAIGTPTGTARVGGTLTAGAVTDPDASPNTDVGTITYQWQTATASAGPFTAAPGTNNTATYTIASDQSQIGSWLRVMASYPNAGGDSLTSDAVVVAGVQVSQTALNVTEGGTTTSYNLMLGSQPTHAVTISVTSDNAAVTVSPVTLSFTTSNWNQAQTVTVMGVEDANGDSETGVQLTHTVSSSDTVYAGMTPPAVTVNVMDIDTGVSASTATLAVDEGGTNMYTLNLNTRPTHAVTIAVTSDHPAVTLNPATLSFDMNNWNQAQAVTVTAIEDANATSETGVQLSHALSSSDTLYAAVTPPTVTVSVTDNDTASVTVSTTTLAVNEGRTNQYTLRLATPPSHEVTLGVTSDHAAATVSPATLRFDMNTWNQVQTVTVMGVEDADTNDVSGVQLRHTVRSSDTLYAALTPPVVTVSVTDNDVGVTVSTTTLAVNEGGTSEYTLRLETQPTHAVMLSVTSDHAAVTVTSPLTFDRDNWNRLQTVTVTAVEDANTDSERGVQLSHTMSSSDTRYAALIPPAVTVSVTDNDAGVVVSTDTLAVNEGGTSAYTLRLTTPPSHDVTLSVASDNAAVSVNPASLRFNRFTWNQVQTVTVTGAEDADTDSETGVQLSHTVSSSDAGYAAVTPSAVTVSVTDNDTAAVLVSTTRLTVNEGGTSAYTLRLATPPSHDVTLSVTSDNAAVTVTASLTFTRHTWNQAQTVTVTGVEDANATGETGVQLSHAVSSSDTAYAAVTPLAVTVTVTDNDTPGVTVIASPATVAVGESHTGGYRVVLNTRPSADVTVAVTSGDPEAVSATPSLTFSKDNWDSMQTVMVTGVEDADSNHESVRLSHTVTSMDSSYNGVAVTVANADRDDNSGTVTVTVTDNEVAGATVSATLLTVAEGSTVTYTLELNTRPSAAVTVMVSSDAQDAVTATPSLTFTTTNWNVARTVTVTGVEDTDASNERVRLSHTVSSMDNDYNDVSIFPVVVNTTDNDNDTAGVGLSATALTVAEGGNNTFTVVLNSLPTDIVSMVISNPDDGAVSISPSDFVFSGADWNQPRTVTVMAVEDTDARDERVSLTLNSASTDLNYDGRAAARSVAVTVTDDEVPPPGVTVSLTTLAVAEGGTGDYTVVLDAPPRAAVNITVRSDDISAATATSPLMFTSDNWSMPQTVTVMGVEDVDAVSESGVRLSHRVSSTDARYGTLTPDAVMVNLTDNDTAGLDVVTELNVKEGEMGTLTLKLHSRPTHPVVVLIESADTAIATVTPSPSLTFNETNWHIARTVTVTGIEDADASDAMVALRLGSISADLGYLGLAASIAVTVTDDDKGGLLVTPTMLTLGEGGRATYTVVLDSKPFGNVQFNLRPATGTAIEHVRVAPGNLFFGQRNWNQPQTVTLTGVEDADTNNESVRLLYVPTSLNSVDTATFTTTVSVDVTVTDNDVVGVTVDPTNRILDERGNSAYTLVLNTRPTDPVTVAVASDNMNAATVIDATRIFDTNNWNAAQTVTVFGVPDPDTHDANVRLTHTATSMDTRYHSVAITPVTLRVTDSDTAAVTVAPSSRTLAEGGLADSYTVRLSHRPTADVSIAVTSADAGAVSVSPATLMLTADNWDEAQTVTIRAVEDADATDESVRLRHAATSADSHYNAIAIAHVTARVNDDETAGVTVTSSALSVPEGGSADYTLMLTSQPSADVTVNLSRLDHRVATASPTRLTFTTSDWRTARTVTVRGVQDPDANPVSIKLSHRAKSADPAYNEVRIDVVDVTVTDDDTAGMTVTPGRLTVGEGGTGSYTLALSTRPSADVRIMVTSENTAAATVSSTPLMFTTSNWSQARTVRVVAVEDANMSNETVLLTHTASSRDSTYNGSAVTTMLPVTVADNDAVGVTVDPTNPTIDEGGTGSYMVVLNTRPTDEVRVTVSNGNTAGATASPATLTFTTDNWNTVQTVTLTGVEDGDTSNASVRLSHTSASADSAYNAGAVTIAAVDVTVRDDDTAGVAVSQTALTILEGGSGNYMLALTSQPDAAVTIAVSSANTAAVTATATLTFTEDNWNTAQTVTVMGVDDADANDVSGVQLSHAVTSTGTAYAAVTAAAVSVTVNDDDTAGLTVTPGRVTVGEGGSGTYMLVLTSRPNAAVTVAVSSPDTDAVTVTATLTFNMDNWNSAQTVTVMGVRDADENDERVQLSHTVTSTDIAYRAVTAAVVVTVTEFNLDVDGSGGTANQSDGLMIGRYLFGIRDMAGLLDTIPGSPSFSEISANIARGVASGRLDVDGSGGAANQSDGLMIGRYLFGIRDTAGLLDTIPGNPSFSAVTTNIGALLQ